MEKEFWLGKWERHEIGFHQAEYSPYLVKYWNKLATDKGTVFVPLCGKTKDMLFFVEQGHKVIGVELSEIACNEFFADNNIEYEVEQLDKLKLYKAKDLQIYCGDLFDLDPAILSDVSYVFDRASLIALPHEIRLRYVDFMDQHIGNAKYFLITIHFDNQEVGPPFAMNADMVTQYFGSRFAIEPIESKELPLEMARVHKGKITNFFVNCFFMHKR